MKPLIPDLAALIDELPALKRDELVALGAQCAAAQAAVAAVLAGLNDRAAGSGNKQSTTLDSDHALTAAEVASRLGFGVDYIYRHVTDFPFAQKIGGRWRFSSQGLTEYLSRNKR